MRNTGQGITMPVGDVVLGHVFNVIGEPLDVHVELVEGIDEWWEIHRHAPAFDTLEPSRPMFETGIKVIDLLTPTCRAARSACSAGPAWARPCSSRR